MDNLPIQIRGLDQDDHGLILLSWVEAVMCICPRIRTPEWAWIDERYLRARYWELVDSVLTQRPELFVCAVHPDHPSQIFGWACIDPDCIHMAYTKDPFRRYGVASMLIDSRRETDGWVTSHWTTYCDRIGGIAYHPEAWERLLNEVDRPKKGFARRSVRILENTREKHFPRNARRPERAPDALDPG